MAEFLGEKCRDSELRRVSIVRRRDDAAENVLADAREIAHRSGDDVLGDAIIARFPAKHEPKEFSEFWVLLRVAPHG